MSSNHDEKLPAKKSVNVERWLGRREAFALIAGRCSAFDAASLREIREEKLWVDSAASWDEFCRIKLQSSRHRIDNIIRQLDEHGLQFFHACQAHHLTEPEYIKLKEHFTAEGFQNDGQLIPWGEENSDRLADAI